MQDITRAHIDSFNYFLTHGLCRIVKHIEPVEFYLGEEDKGSNRHKLRLSITQIFAASPQVSILNKYAVSKKIFPAECRQKASTYSGELQVHVKYECSTGQKGTVEKMAGLLPIMVKSQLCNISGLDAKDLIARGEEAGEMGGYFIVNGNEKVVRLLIQQRRNYPLCFTRGTWKNRGPEYTEFGVSARCVQEDENSNTITLHYLNNGTAKLAFGFNKEVFFVPIVIVLKALLDVTDKQIFKSLISGKENDFYFKSCVILMLRETLKEENLKTKTAVLKFIGKTFRIKLSLPEWYTDEEAGSYLIRKSIAIHLSSNQDKFNFLVYMTQKLFSFVNGKCCTENADSPMFQEVLLPGHIMQMLLKEKLEIWLQTFRLYVQKAAIKKGVNFGENNNDIKDSMKFSQNISRAMEYFLSTGNLISRDGLGLQQTRGFCIVADKLNFMRYLSHFRAVHRGSFFTEMRTTSVRKLLPEAWGFLCPVHTPDGTPCGLLNHLSSSCKIVNNEKKTSHLGQLLTEIGMIPLSAPSQLPISECYVVMLDGKVLGYVSKLAAQDFIQTLRILKVKGKGEVPFVTEICFVKATSVSSQYPGIYLFTSISRMMRPVINLNVGAVEMIGTFEQVYLDIGLNKIESEQINSSHQEICEQNILSIVASLTPFSDFNQSPRNMYQCQMGKQTMGTPLQAFPYRGDNKLYRIQTPQSPIVRPAIYNTYGFDEYPLGTNAVVAVISYTGYDMEDAMIINKSSFERGFGHGSVIKSEFVDLAKVGGGEYNSKTFVFAKDPEDTSYLDVDGLPPVGSLLEQGVPFYSYVNVNTGRYTTVMYKSSEPSTVLQIKMLGDGLGNSPGDHVCFVLRVSRNATIGDKFSSRHGQKGILSMLWPAVNMPFSESGMCPDIIFNPHGYPSRMTIGMMIESMAGKAGALHGMYLDATPFTFSEDQSAINHFGEMLTAGGYNYYGTERLYSGITGQEMEADIYLGVVYYQRLRHMVSDKFQVRTTGTVDQITQQPVKGRKAGGGVRFGEMERDALIAHGSSFLLQDRFLNCSDKSKASICVSCKTILSPILVKESVSEDSQVGQFKHQVECCHCKKRDTIEQIAVPFVFKYLVAELASIGINTNLAVKSY